MCGISGVIHYGEREPITTEHLATMMRRLAHRGPDADGLYVAETRAVAFGSNRLSIQDLSANGHQPMFKHGLVVVFNGELFNFHEVRAELIAEGYHFLTQTDTEVFLSAFDRWGIECLHKFNGFFAILLHDTKTDEVFVIRDRLGVKPVVFLDNGQSLLVASEVKALAAYPGIALQPDLDTILCDLIFNFWGDKERTYFRGIRYLKPGCYLHITAGQVNYQRYWDLPTFDDVDPRNWRDLVEELYALLTDAVTLRLVADCEVGSILSGGLDSSLMSQIAASHSAYPLQCFTLQYDEQEDEDLRMARLLTSQHPNMRHSVVKIALEDMQSEAIDRVTYHMEEVLLDKAYYAIYRNYRSAHEADLKVVLNGQGSDEVWLGYYNTYPFIKLFQNGLNLERFAQYWIEQFAFKAYVNPQQMRDVIQQHISTYLDGLWVQNRSALDAFVNFGVRTYLQSMLMQEDRLSMAHSVECRVPYVDYRVIAFGLRIPAKLKVLDGREKYLLRKVAERILPQAIYTRHKSVLPDLPDYFGAMADTSMQRPGFFDSSLLNEIFTKSLRHDLKSLPAVERWKVFSIQRFEDVFFR